MRPFAGKAERGALFVRYGYVRFDLGFPGRSSGGIRDGMAVAPPEGRRDRIALLVRYA